MHPHRRHPVRPTALLAALLAVGVPSLAQGPRQNLQVELRWVESELSGSTVAGIRDGSTVVSTGGSVSARGGVTLSTENREQRQQLFPRVLVLNGSQASFTMTESTPIQWADVALDRQPGDPRDRVIVLPRQGMAERVRGIVVRPNWPGGRSPVNVEVRATDQSQMPPGAQGGYGNPQGGYGTHADSRPSTDVLSTVQAPLGVWVTIARTGSVSTSAGRNVYSTRDAEVQRLRELQLRVDVAP